MNTRTFKGGIHPPHGKHFTERKPIEAARVPSKVVIPLQQHIGAPCDPLVQVGDEVKVGQKIGEPKGFVGAPVHSSVSGKVVAIQPYPHVLGNEVLSIVIESNGKQEVSEDVKPHNLNLLTVDELKKLIREAGIVGMGGATFPTQVKLSPPPDKKIDTVIINGAECEPYLTADFRLMVEQPENVVLGLKAIMKALNVVRGFIAIEDNKPEAIQTMTQVASEETDIEVVPLATKYPQGGEKQLIKAVTGREVPSGGLPMEVGVVVQNVGTANAIAEAILTGMPLIQRVVTITGTGVAEPKNLLVKIGTTYREVIEQCGGFSGTPRKVISGGPMMGLAQSSIDIPVIKGTSGILVLTDKDVKEFDQRPCIKCARCVDACPAFLLPTRIAHFADKMLWDEAESYRALDCIECGSCSFVCPAKIPLVQRIRLAKAQIMAKRKKK